MIRHRYTEQEHEFFKEYVPGHSWIEIADEFEKRFGIRLGSKQVQSYIKNHKLHTGRNGRFEKGHVPANKGQKVSAETYEKISRTFFKKGHGNDKRRRTVGSERVDPDGYIRIKVAEPNEWMLKSWYVWQQHHGAMPPDHYIIYKDNDPSNCDISNLMMISKRDAHIMMIKNLHHYTGDEKEVAVNIAKLIRARIDAQKRSRDEK